VQAVIGHTRSITYTVDVVDEFFNGRGQLTVDSDHPNIRGGHDITVGKGNKGRVRVSVAVSDTLDPGTYELRLRLADWMKSSGGTGPTLEHTTKIELVEEIPVQGNGSGKPTPGTGTAGSPSEGTSVALVWKGLDDEDSWTRTTIGEIVDTPLTCSPSPTPITRSSPCWASRTSPRWCSTPTSLRSSSTSPAATSSSTP